MNNDKTVNTLQNDNAVCSPFFVYCFLFTVQPLVINRAATLQYHRR